MKSPFDCCIRNISVSKLRTVSHVINVIVTALFAAASAYSYANNNEQQTKFETYTTLNDSSLKAADETIDIAGLEWFTDYYAAYREAAKQQRVLLVNFTPRDNSKTQHAADEAIATQTDLRAKLNKVVLCRVPIDVEIDSAGKSKKLLAFGAFRELHNGPGFVLIDLTNRDAPYYGSPVSVLPLHSGKYYRWSAQGLAVALDLPAGTLTQRTLIWSVRMHPEKPQSTGSEFNPHLADGAAQHASYQAKGQQQGHQNFKARFHRLSAAAGSSVTEVCAESWPNQTLIDSCIDCVASWRHSSGHWRAVSRPHRAFGYDIHRGRNGIWYGTGLFAD